MVLPVGNCRCLNNCRGEASQHGSNLPLSLRCWQWPPASLRCRQQPGQTVPAPVLRVASRHGLSSSESRLLTTKRTVMQGSVRGRGGMAYAAAPFEHLLRGEIILLATCPLADTRGCRGWECEIESVSDKSDSTRSPALVNDRLSHSQTLTITRSHKQIAHSLPHSQCLTLFIFRSIFRHWRLGGECARLLRLRLSP